MLAFRPIGIDKSSFQQFGYDFLVEYRPGKQNSAVDALSRRDAEVVMHALSAPCFPGLINCARNRRKHQRWSNCVLVYMMARKITPGQRSTIYCYIMVKYLCRKLLFGNKYWQTYTTSVMRGYIKHSIACVPTSMFQACIA